MKLLSLLAIFLLQLLLTFTIDADVIRNRKRSKYHNLLHGMFLNSWAVVVHGNSQMASKVAAENGFINIGRAYGSVYEFVHRGMPRRRKRAAYVKTLHLKMDTRVVWAQQQISKIRVKREIEFNDEKWKQQWYLHRTEPGYEEHDMNIMPVWERGITGKGIVITVLDDGLEHTHPEIRENYDPQASYDYNNNDTDPMPSYTWRDDNRHGTRCAAEAAAAANNSNCIVGVAYEAKIGGIRMLDGEINDLVESKSLRHAIDHVDIYSSSWGPADNGKTIDGPGPLTEKALAEGAKNGRQGKGSIYVWASGNGGEDNDHCNCDGYTNSIYTIAVSAATSIGLKPWYVETCASILVSAYGSGISSREKPIITADLGSRCTKSHTGTSVSPPLISGIVALALQVNPNLNWRDVQHLLVETSTTKHLIGNEFRVNGVGKRYSHHFGFGVVNAGKMVSLAENWPTVSEQRKCHHWKKLPKYPFNCYNSSTPLVIDINSTACKGSPQYINYIEHVHIQATIYHYRRGANEIRIQSPMGTNSWVLRERSMDSRGGFFSDWKFLSTHFWGENPSGNWKVVFYSKDDIGQGFLEDLTLIIYGTEHKPGQSDPSKKPLKCHDECKMGCSGTTNHQCTKCQRYSYLAPDSKTYCLEKCPSETFTLAKSMTCLPCHPTCLTCSNADRTHCLSCPPKLALYDGSCVQMCPSKMFHEYNPYKGGNVVCRKCADRCLACNGKSDNCSACEYRSALVGSTCVAKCKPDEWLSGELCKPCDRTCKTCSGGSHANCTLCPKKRLNSVENRYFFKGHCLTDCPLGTFKGNSIKQTCLECPNHCLQCSNEGRKCDICEVGYLRLTVGDVQCSRICPAGYYTDIIRRVCEPCNPHCETCVPGNPQACTSCSDGYYLKNHECVSAAECSSRYYVNITSRKCNFCPLKCFNCESAESCQSCFFNYFHTPDDKCEEQCPNGTFSRDRTSECEKCDMLCAECNGPTSRDCTACHKGFLLQNGVCKKNVSPGFYAEKVAGGGLIMKKCHFTCKTCFGPTAQECFQCIETLDKRDATCVNPCPGQYLSENSCQNCHSSCKACFGPSAHHCLKCHGNFSLNVDSYTCNKMCHRKFYKDVQTLTCKPCHQSCASCYGPTSNQCLTCPEKLHYHNQTCLWQCPSGYYKTWYKTYGQVCDPCSEKCKNCRYKKDFCTHCADNEVWQNYKCFKDCGIQQFADESGRCFPCHESCLNCSGTAPNECNACKPDMTFHNGLCLPGCLPGFYHNTTENKCLPCMDSCLKCQETNLGFRCLVCNSSTLLQPNGKCGATCPPSSYRVPTDNRCNPCPGKGCLTCEKDLGKTCATCKPLHELSKGFCKSTCDTDRYPDEKTKKCNECHPLCLSCDGPGKENCKRCSQKALILVAPDKVEHCLATCPPGFYIKGRYCVKCEPFCTSCASKEKCSSCEPPLIVHKYKCVESCPDRYFMNNQKTNCISCRQKFGSCAMCNHTKCFQCMPGSYLLNGMCTYNCGKNYISKSGSCLHCADAFENCKACNAFGCKKCQEKFRMIEGKCRLCKNSACSEYFTTTTASSTRSLTSSLATTQSSTAKPSTTKSTTKQSSSTASSAPTEPPTQTLVTRSATSHSITTRPSTTVQSDTATSSSAKTTTPSATTTAASGTTSKALTTAASETTSKALTDAAAVTTTTSTTQMDNTTSSSNQDLSATANIQVDTTSSTTSTDELQPTANFVPAKRPSVRIRSDTTETLIDEEGSGGAAVQDDTVPDEVIVNETADVMIAKINAKGSLPSKTVDIKEGRARKEMHGENLRMQAPISKLLDRPFELTGANKTFDNITETIIEVSVENAERSRRSVENSNELDSKYFDEEEKHFFSSSKLFNFSILIIVLSLVAVTVLIYVGSSHQQKGEIQYSHLRDRNKKEASREQGSFI